MTEREQFEKAFPVPKGMAYAEKYHAYMRSGGDLETPKAIYYNESWQAWQAARATPALPQAEHDLEDVRCQCCGYMTYHSEHTGCIRSAYKQALPQVPEGMAIVSAMADDAYQALQNELSVMQAAIESYETPAAALKALIDWHVAVATDPRVNGGMALVPVDVLDDVVNLAGYSVTHTEFNSSLRRSFIKCGDLLAATKEKGE